MTIDVAIIGGGISGLAAAYELNRQGYQVAVLERQQRAGGNAVSERFNGFLMEHGPSTVNAASDTAINFSRELGLEAARCGLEDGVRRRYLVGGGKLRGISTHPLGFLTSGYLSPMGRLRLMAEFAVSRCPHENEETVWDFCSRRFGREFTERVLDPLVGGVYAGRASELSMPAVFPKLMELEKEYGSVSIGVMRRYRRGGKMPGSRLFSWRDGIGTLPKTLAQRLGNAVHTGVAVQSIQPLAGGYRIDAGAAGAFNAPAVIIATQPHVAAQLLDKADRPAAEAARGIDAPPLAVVFLGFKRNKVEHPLDGLGFLTPESEGRSLTGAQFCSTMFPGRSPPDHVAVAAYIGGVRAPQLAQLPAADLIELAQSEFRDLIGTRSDPVVARVRHWPRGLPQYRLGHELRRAELESTPQRQPGLYITGNYLAGPSVAVCLDQAMTTASKVGQFLASSRDRTMVKAAK